MEMEAVVEWVGKFLGRFLGTQNERAIRRYWSLVREKINPLESKMMVLPDAEFPKLSEAFRARLAKGEPLDDLLPEAFAACREAARRSVRMRHFDVQLIGGAVLHSGRISGIHGGGQTPSPPARIPKFADEEGRPRGCELHRCPHTVVIK
jgi:preprotein translocase subunit SecA